MRILHINSDYIINCNLHHTMLQHFGCMDIDNYVFATEPHRGEWPAGISPDKVKISKWVWKHKFPYTYEIRRRYVTREIEQCYEISEFDCIHTYFLFNDGYCARKLLKKYGVPYLTTVRNTDLNDFFLGRKRLKRYGIKILKDSDAVFFLCPAYKNYVINKILPKKLRKDIEDKSYIIPDGIDDFWLKNKNIAKEYNSCFKRVNNKYIRIIFAGAIEVNKNPVAILEAITILESKGWKVDFIVAGKIVDKNVYDTIFPRIIYKGVLSKDKLIEEYRDADVFVMPSHKESFGLVYAEAMSQGLPVVYTRGQGFDGQFPEGQVGYAVDDNNPNEIADAIERICSNYEEISRNCVRMVDKFDWNEIDKEYYKIYSIVGNVQSK